MKLIFWNCGVAPTRGKPKRCVAEAAEVVCAAFREGAAIVALAEVDEATMKDLASKCARKVQRINITEPIGRTRWDLGVLYSPSAARCRKGGPVEGLAGGQNLRGGYSVNITNKQGNLEFRLYLLHWRSRLRSEGAEERLHQASLLWNSVRDDLSKDCPVVVLGDFNDEPFDMSLSHLNASRDPKWVLRRKKSCLYNPTWWLASPPAEAPADPFGTIEYRGNGSSAFLFDQALTSYHFLDLKRSRFPRASLGQTSPTKDHRPLELELL